MNSSSEVNKATHIFIVRHLDKSTAGLIHLAHFRWCSSALKKNHLKIKQFCVSHNNFDVIKLTVFQVKFILMSIHIFHVKNAFAVSTWWLPHKRVFD